MKKLLLIAIALLLVFGTRLNAQSAEWISDVSHSTIQFSVSHLVISETTGSFKIFEASVVTDQKDFENAIINFNIMIESIDTDDQTRDNHLLSGDFFDAENYPSINFEGISYTKIEDNRYKLKGKLTIKNITREEEFDVTYGGTVKDPYGNTKAGFKLVGKINRFDYGLKWNTLLETGGAVVGEEVNISCNIELHKN